MTDALGTLQLARPDDLLRVQRGTRQLALLLGFQSIDAARLATAATELSRIAMDRGTRASVEYAIAEGTELQLSVTAEGGSFSEISGDIDDWQASDTPAAARALFDRTELTIDATRFTIRCTEPLTSAVVAESVKARVIEELSPAEPLSPIHELEQQNRDLLAALHEVRSKREDLERLNGELEDTNRGVLALYSELDDRAERLRHVNELKSRFLSYMSHEFRTPLSSILAIARILLAEVDGPLTGEQQKQVQMIRDAATDLAGTVNDLLDLSKIEAGRIEIRPSKVAVADLFSALRGMFRPLVGDAKVTLTFEEKDSGLVLYTDETRLAQILRNLIGNAIKFTSEGEISVTAARETGETILLTVRDTGIGIPPAFQERIFEEFSQLDSPLQRRVHGTGLGLPLCRKLAALLGGSVALESVPGSGSTFRVTLPLRYEAPAAG